LPLYRSPHTLANDRRDVEGSGGDAGGGAGSGTSVNDGGQQASHLACGAGALFSARGLAGGASVGVGLGVFPPLPEGAGAGQE